jgi:putative Mn2+ efflux pump MntP
MFLSIVSGLVVSVDAFFIGLSLGLQEKCKFVYLALINAFLFFLCVLGFFIAKQIEIPIESDLIVGFAFIGMGLWTIFQTQKSGGTLFLVGLVMSGEAMVITMGLTIIFAPHSTIAIPLTVALAHFGYSSLSFFLARTKYMKRIPLAISHIISGLALIVYGLFALFL